MKYILCYLISSILFISLQSLSMDENKQQEFTGWTTITRKPTRTQQYKLDKEKKEQEYKQREAKRKERTAKKQIENEAYLEREARRKEQAESLWQQYEKTLEVEPQSIQPIQNLKAVFLQEVERKRWLKEQTKKVGSEQALASAPWRQPCGLEGHPFYAKSIEREIMQGNREHPWRTEIQEFLKINEYKYLTKQSAITQSRFQLSDHKLVGHQQATSSSTGQVRKLEIPKFQDAKEFPALGSCTIADQEERARQIEIQRSKLFNHANNIIQQTQVQESNHFPKSSSQSRAARIAFGMSRLLDYNSPH